MTDGPLWLVTVDVPGSAAAVFLDAFEGLGDSISCFEIANGASWRLEALCANAPDREALAARLELAAVAAGIAPPQSAMRRLPPRDWLAENRKQFPPVAVGRFFVHGSHFEGKVPAGAMAIALDAGLAFGSGTHETTRGCLLAIDRLARRKPVRRALDLGCGSGILAIAMAKRWRAPVLAADNDPVAVAVTRGNARRNHVAMLVRTAVSDGFASRTVAGGRPYDVIAANILARPLRAMARDLASALAPGGRLILSGFTAKQEAGVIAAGRRQGLRLETRLRLGDWLTVLLRR